MVTLWGLVASTDAWAIDRRNWYFEQLVAPPAPSRLDIPRHQVALAAMNFADSLSFQAMALADLRALELKAQFSERVFPRVSALGRELEPLLADDKRSLGLELARYFVTSTRQYGRLGMEGLWFTEVNHFYFKFSLAAGVVDGPDSPWAMGLTASYLLSAPRRGADLLSIQLESKRRILGEGQSAVALGGFLSWTYRLREAAGVGDFEMMLFSFGPVVTWGRLRASMMMRLFVDKRLDAAGNGTNPSDIQLPDIAVSWTLPF